MGKKGLMWQATRELEREEKRAKGCRTTVASMLRKTTLEENEALCVARKAARARQAAEEAEQKKAAEEARQRMREAFGGSLGGSETRHLSFCMLLHVGASRLLVWVCPVVALRVHSLVPSWA